MDKEIRLLILGASGLVGSNCQRYFSEIKVPVLGTFYSYQTEDTLFYDTLNAYNPLNCDIRDFKPTHILHAGALTHVDYCEKNEEESYEKTVLSTQNMLAIAKELNAAFIYISTDYVFDGKNGPYSEDTTVNPLSVYGRHKLQAEELVKSQAANHLILRVTNVYGDEARGKNFVARLAKLAKDGIEQALSLPVDQYATPVDAYDIAKALYELIASDKTGIYHIASTDYLNRIQLAQKVLSYFPKHNILLKPVHTADFGQPAARPLQGGLKAAKFLTEFPLFRFSSIDEYMRGKV